MLPWGGICYRERAPRGIRHRGGSVTAPVDLSEHHATCRETARGGGGDARRVLLQKGEAIHHHRYGGDVRCGL